MLAAVPIAANLQAVFNTSLEATAVLLVLAVASVVVSLVTFTATDKFLWFGVAAFVAVGIFIGAATYTARRGQLKVEGAAALRENRRTRDRVVHRRDIIQRVLGTFEEGKGRSRLLVLPRSQIADLAVAPLQTPGIARHRALGLALDLCNQEILKVSKQSNTAAARTASSRPCTDKQEKRLRGQREIARPEVGS